MSKYRSRKVTVDGVTYDSKKEYKRWCALRLMQQAGEITGLERQVKYELIPAQYRTVETGERYTRNLPKYGIVAGMPKTKKVCLEQGCDYIADFVYWKDGAKVVEDAKGYRDPSSAGYAKFVIKRKLMLWLYGIKIREV